MSAASNFELETAGELTGSLTARTLRLWCAPELMLAVTNLADEETLLIHAIRQARRTAAKVLLIHVLQSRSSRAGLISRTVGSTYSADLALRVLDRMARKLRWVGIQCEPVLLKGDPAEEILTFAKARGVQRILLTVQSEKRPIGRTLAEEISPWAGVPICVVREGVMPALKYDRPVGRITLATSLRSDCEPALDFACRFAQEHGARLTVMHVFEDGTNVAAIDHTAAAIASRLPVRALREAELFCRLQIAVREGDPATELLKHETDTNQDIIILGAPRSPVADEAHDVGIVHRILNEARCPIIILGRSHALARSFEQLSDPSNPPQFVTGF